MDKLHQIKIKELIISKFNSLMDTKYLDNYRVQYSIITGEDGYEYTLQKSIIDNTHILRINVSRRNLKYELNIDKNIYDIGFNIMKEIPSGYLTDEYYSLKAIPIEVINHFNISENILVITDEDFLFMLSTIESLITHKYKKQVKDSEFNRVKNIIDYI